MIRKGTFKVEKRYPEELLEKDLKNNFKPKYPFLIRNGVVYLHTRDYDSFCTKTAFGLIDLKIFGYELEQYKTKEEFKWLKILA